MNARTKCMKNNRKSIANANLFAASATHRMTHWVSFMNIGKDYLDLDRFFSYSNIFNRFFHSFEQFWSDKQFFFELFKMFEHFSIFIQHFHIFISWKFKFFSIISFHSLSSYLKKHYPSLYNKKSELNEYFCEKCGEIFGLDQDALELHIESFHTKKGRTQNFAITSTVRPYLCEVCGKGYTQSSHLYQHLRFHKGNFMAFQIRATCKAIESKNSIKILIKNYLENLAILREFRRKK